VRCTISLGIREVNHRPWTLTSAIVSLLATCPETCLPHSFHPPLCRPLVCWRRISSWWTETCMTRAKSSHVCSYEYTPIAGASCGLIYLPIFHKRICPFSCTCRSLVRRMSAATPVSFKSLLKGGLLNDDMSSVTWTWNLRTIPQYYVRLPQNNLEPKANYRAICYVSGISLHDLVYLSTFMHLMFVWPCFTDTVI